jgi:hypothetical protein
VTDRFWNVWTLALGLLGLVIVVALVVIGLDLRRAKTRGPRWKRRIIAAGLAVLAAVGAYPVAEQHPYNQPEFTCYMPMRQPVLELPDSSPAPAPQTPPNSPTTEPSGSQGRLDLLREFGESGILARPVVERAREQYGEEA